MNARRLLLWCNYYLLDTDGTGLRYKLTDINCAVSRLVSQVWNRNNELNFTN